GKTKGLFWNNLYFLGLLQGKGKFRPDPRHTFDIDFFVVGLYNMFYNGQSQSRSPFCPVPTVIYPIKPLEKPGDVLLGNTFPIIRNSYDYLVLDKVLYADFGSAVRMAVFNGIHQ